MARGTTVYQCPACTGPLHFDGKLGKLKCDYCGRCFHTAGGGGLLSGEGAQERPRKLIKKRHIQEGG